MHLVEEAKMNLWVEKYRPQTLEDIILPTRIKTRFKNGLDTNLLFVGTQGVGKTTLAKILARNFSTKVINASLDNGIDSVRNQIVNFCSSAASFKSNYKVVILDESDHLSTQAQAAIRGTIEEYHQVARFIFTCNYPEKILDPIKSRLEIIDFNFTEEEEQEQIQETMRRVVAITRQENLKISADAIRALMKTYFPDLRSIIKNLQSIAKTTEGTIEESDVTKISTSEPNLELYNFLINARNPEEIYSFISGRFKNKEYECYKSLGTQFIDFLITYDKHKRQIGKVASIIHRYQYESDKSIDKLIPLLACCFELSMCFR